MLDFARLADAIETDWTAIGRPEQQLPAGDWLYWLMLTGRGWGKTGTLSETVRIWIKAGFNYVNVIGATADDVRSVSIEGPAGILACCPASERPEYFRRNYELRWPNGAVSLVFSAEEPDRLRGKQHQKLICDELASWRDPDAWNQALLGLRLGRAPQVAIATTPRPTKIIKALVADPRTHLTTGKTYDNIDNLAPAFIHGVIQRFEGTRQGRQELHAEILADVPGGLWTRAMIERAREPVEAPDFARVVVGVDPSGARSADDKSADLIGIVIAARDAGGRGYILADRSLKASPAAWGRVAVDAFHEFKADRIVAEVNFGAAMVQHVIRTADSTVAFKEVSASRSKVRRSEPIAALYEQGRISHLCQCDALEDELCGMTADGYAGGGSPDRADAAIWALSELLCTSTGGEQWVAFYRELAKAVPPPIYDAAPDPLPWRDGLTARARTNPLTQLYIETKAESTRAIAGAATCAWCGREIAAGSPSRSDGFTSWHYPGCVPN
jgi:phage terminase large subunit-like protein